MTTIKTLAELINILSNAKAGGQYVSLKGVSPYAMNKRPTDGSGNEPIKKDFSMDKEFFITMHFGQSYEKAMAKALGVSTYEAHDSNRLHLLKNVLMQFINSGTICFIVMPEKYKVTRYLVDGIEATEEQVNYAKRYKKKSNQRVVKYLTIGVSRIHEMCINNTRYKIDIQTTTTGAA